jgi:glycosyltransferase involved in cell wall biosynthesis
MWRDTIAWLRPQLDALGDKVQVRGFLQPTDIAQHLAAADLCVFPSLWDNFPSACLEAMSAARPIVATRSGGMEDMLGDGEAGLLVPGGDARALADAICRLIADPALRLQLATRARDRLAATYTPAVLGLRYEALYAEATERRTEAMK